jgi:hypothetical protein
MPKQGWIAFTDAHRDAHVIVALVLPKSPRGTDKARVESSRTMLEILIERLRLTGAYATRIVRQGGIAEIYCAFEKEADAQRLANAVRARPTWQHPGWASQWSFVLDAQQPRRSKPH